MGVAAVVITPDAPEVLARFAAAQGIVYPLLSDIGGRVIDEFGLRNHNIVPNERQADGIPFPGHFLLDAAGRVRAKAFTGDLRHRPSTTVLVAESAGAYGGPSAVIECAELRAEVQLSTGRLFGGQEAALRIDVAIAEGWHVYAQGVEAPYVALALDIDIERAVIDSVELRWRPPEPVTVDVLGTRLPVYEGACVARGRLRLRWSPPPSMFGGLEEAVNRRAIAPGTYSLSCELRFQACRDDLCLEPRSMRFSLPIVVEATVAPTPAAQTDVEQPGPTTRQR